MNEHTPVSADARTELGISGLGLNLNENELLCVANAAEEIEFKKGKRIIDENSQSTDIYLVLSGQVSVWFDVSGMYKLEEKEAIINTGDIFGEFAFVNGKPRTASIQADTNVCVLKLGYAAMMKLFADNPVIGYKMMRNIAILITAKMADNQKELKKLLFYN